MVKLFSKNSNLCDHNSPTLQTDRQTTCDRNTALCTKVHRAVKIGKYHVDKTLPLPLAPNAAYTQPYNIRFKYTLTVEDEHLKFGD